MNHQSVQAALQALREGKLVLVIDDEDRGELHEFARRGGEGPENRRVHAAIAPCSLLIPQVCGTEPAGLPGCTQGPGNLGSGGG